MDVTIKVAKETYELGEAVAALVKDVKGRLVDGWQPVGDSIAISSDVLKDLIPGLAGAERIKGETTDQIVFAQTCAVIGAHIVQAIIG